MTATNCSEDNGGCDHECTDSQDGLARTCSCVHGYTLQDDSRTCQPKGERSQDRLSPIGRPSGTDTEPTNQNKDA